MKKKIHTNDSQTNSSKKISSLSLLYSLLLVVLVVSTTFFTSCSSSKNIKRERYNGFSFERPNKKLLTLKFKLINNLIVIPVRINDSDTLHFILDSGVENMLITELSLGDKLQVSYLKEIELSGLGSGEKLMAYASPDNNFNISGIIGHHQDLLILKEDIFHLSSRFGMRIHGIMGYGIFADFIVKVNYESATITFYNKRKYKYKPHKKDIRIPIEIINAKPYIWAKVEQDSAEVPVKLLIDTGGGHAIWLDVSSSEKLQIPQKKKQAYLGKGMRGDITGYLGRSSKLILKDIELKKVTTAFPDSTSIATVRGQGQRNGSLGSEILRRFHVIMNYSNNTMILRPNRNFKAEFNYNMAGIELSTPVPGSAIYLVSNIEKDSPVANLDIKKNDQIVSINGTNINKFTIHQIYELFRSKEGRKIELRLRRNGDVFDERTIKFRLENPI
ncbi:aspartyl protease family protein [Bernardetia sp.]|uniref:aspartyl protease family protein n=1 Tax=Bernardetia sp. TaxID=1937974 RepID=UPI0025BD5DA9|nr:aspartyl protease family protein [Bernardetia sp.]